MTYSDITGGFPRKKIEPYLRGWQEPASWDRAAFGVLPTLVYLGCTAAGAVWAVSIVWADPAVWRSELSWLWAA